MGSSHSYLQIKVWSAEHASISMRPHPGASPVGFRAAQSPFSAREGLDESTLKRDGSCRGDGARARERAQADDVPVSGKSSHACACDALGSRHGVNIAYQMGEKNFFLRRHRILTNDHLGSFR